jgi:hypothetical protein
MLIPLIYRSDDNNFVFKSILLALPLHLDLINTKMDRAIF